MRLRPRVKCVQQFFQGAGPAPERAPTALDQMNDGPCGPLDPSRPGREADCPVRPDRAPLQTLGDGRCIRVHSVFGPDPGQAVPDTPRRKALGGSDVFYAEAVGECLQGLYLTWCGPVFNPPPPWSPDSPAVPPARSVGMPPGAAPLQLHPPCGPTGFQVCEPAFEAHAAAVLQDDSGGHVVAAPAAERAHAGPLGVIAASLHAMQSAPGGSAGTHLRGHGRRRHRAADSVSVVSHLSK